MACIDRTLELASKPQVRTLSKSVAVRFYVCHRTDAAASLDQAVVERAPVRLRVAPTYRLHSETLMSIIAWILLGLIAGFVASKIVNRTGEGVVVDVLLGIVGAVVGGWLFRIFGMHGVTGFNLGSLVVATIGAAAVLLVYHAVSRSNGFRRV
jgi:uncharacterized membrane protein YeaQ/YmgE (transglycosylase-associated protein family)